MIRQLIARLFWAVSPWRLVVERVPDRPTLFIGAPHTSNWDFVLMLGIAWRLRIASTAPNRSSRGSCRLLP